MTPTFQGEVLMRRWSDSSTQGVQITFALPDADDLEPLKAKTGKRFMAVLVEIADDETPVQPPKKDTRGPLCREACDYCKDPAFREWLGVETEEQAAQFIRTECGVNSRKELDTNPSAKEIFRRNVRVLFLRWSSERSE